MEAEERIEYLDQMEFNFMKSALEEAGHINDITLSLYATGYRHFKPGIIESVQSHLEGCELCKDRFNEEFEDFLKERAEEKARGEVYS